jgi:hypothetical protein
MAKKNDPFDFPFGANMAPKKPKSAGKKGSKKKLSAAQKATAHLYMKPRRR